MTITPEYGREERIRQQEEHSKDGSKNSRPQDVAEREIVEHDNEEKELRYLDPEDNEARAPGQVCGRCGAIMTATQDARRLDDHWIHEVCPQISTS